jgi:NAD-dependent dihydropyrimidine dehydrogenase PreA subunit
MTSNPTLWSSLREHLELARKLRNLKIYFDADLCIGVWECYEVCPVDCWKPEWDRNVVAFHHPERCIACNACVLQCPEAAIELR